jgi:excisionase family DNA binding protein
VKGNLGARPQRRLGDVKQVGAVLGCSWRHVLRLADRGAMPWGVKLGALRRWDLDKLDEWINAGCKPVRVR